MRRLYAVADGVTLPYGGRLASTLAIKALSNLFNADLKHSLDQTNDAVRKEASQNREVGSTTLTAAHLNARLEIAHVGDSTGLLLRENQLMLETQPQSRGGYLANAIGEFYQGPETYQAYVEAGDYLVLATDGVTAVLNNAELISIIREEQRPDSIVPRVLAVVKETPMVYRDDRSIIIVKIEG